MLLFILMMIIVFSSLGAITYILNLLLPPVINRYELFCKKFARTILKKQRIPLNILRYLINALVWSSIIFTVLFLILIYTEKSKIYFVWVLIFPLLNILFGTISHELDKVSEKSKRWKEYKIIRFLKDNYLFKYLFNRIIIPMFGKPFFDLAIYIIIIYYLIEILVAIGVQNLPSLLVFIFLCMLPVFLILYIYLRNVEENERNVRRALSYFILFIKNMKYTKMNRLTDYSQGNIPSLI